MDDVLLIVVTLLFFGLLATVVGALDRRLGDRAGGRR